MSTIVHECYLSKVVPLIQLSHVLVVFSNDFVVWLSLSLWIIGVFHVPDFSLIDDHLARDEKVEVAVFLGVTFILELLK